MAKSYVTRLIIQGDSEGGVRAIRATESELAKLDRQAARSAGKTKTAADSMTKSYASMGRYLRYAATGFAAYAGADSIRRLIDANVAMQKINAELSVSTSSAAEAAQEFQFVSDVSNKLGLNLQTTADAYSRLAGSAKSAGLTQEQLHKGFIGLADTFAVLHASTEDVNGVLVQLEQGMSLGKIQMTDLRAIAQHLPGTMELASRAVEDMGGNLKDMLASGGIPAEAFFERFTAELANKYGPQAQRAALGLQGAITRLDNAFFSIESSGNVDGLAGSIDGLASTLNDPGTRQGLQTLVQDLIDITSSAASAAAELGRIETSVDKFFKPLSDSLNYIAGGGAANAVRGALGLSTAHDAKPAPAGEPGKTVTVTGMPAAAHRASIVGEVGTKSQLKAAKQLSEAYASVNGQLAREISLFGRSSETAQIRYQIEHGNLAKLSEQRKQHLVSMAQEIDQLNAQKSAVQELFPEWQKLEQAKQLSQSAADLPKNMQAFGKRRAAQMVQQAATGGLPQMQGLDPQYSGAFGEANRLQGQQASYEQAYQRRLEAYREYAKTHQDDVATANQAIEALNADHEQRTLEYQRQINTAKRKGYESVYGDLTSIVGTFAGQQSSIYQGMFAASKAFAIADSIVSIEQGIANAFKLPFPENLAAAASVAAQTAGIVSTIEGTQMNIAGQAHDGSSYLPSDGTYYMQGGERVVDRSANQDLTKYLNRANQQTTNNNRGGDVVFSPQVTVQAQPNVSQGDAQRQGRNISNELEKRFRKLIIDEKRPGGLLYKAG
ncbi:tape measure protein [Salinisphaera hydrothermalis]|uniref:tape measure protein n=1 Tax=Salinisphaera hydrothermalis TaxID=563188 RepID=UPI00333FE5BB